MTKKCGGPTKALTAEKTSESLLLTTKRPFSSSERVLYKLTLVPQSGWPLPRVPLNQGDPPCSFPAWPPGPWQGWAAGSDRFRLCELRVSQHFSTFYGPSVQAMDIRLNALPILPSALGSFLAAGTPRFSDLNEGDNAPRPLAPCCSVTS